MASDLQTIEPERLPVVDVRDALTRDVRRGLRGRPRSLQPWMFYDADGSRLFEQIARLPEYYPTRVERAILSAHADAILAAACLDGSVPLRVVELGAGTAAKTRIILEAALRLSDDVAYVPVDVCGEALELARQELKCQLPALRVRPVVGNYVTDALQFAPFKGRTLALYIGTSIGNFSPDYARAILRNLRAQLQPGDALLLGTDMVKDEATLLAAYDDGDGVTAAFNLNLLHRLNRELRGDFDVSRFRHRALWNSDESRIEMYLESLQEQVVTIPEAALMLRFERGEAIHTENSYKFKQQGIRSLLDDAGYDLMEAWTDGLGWYAVTLACPRRYP